MQCVSATASPSAGSWTCCVVLHSQPYYEMFFMIYTLYGILLDCHTDKEVYRDVCVFTTRDAHVY